MKMKFRILTAISITLFLSCFTGNVVLAVDERGGIGLKTSQLYDYTTEEDNKRGSMVVLDIFNGSPAQRHGIQKGDLIIKINNETTKGKDFQDLLHNCLRGPSFTNVILEIWRPRSHEKIELIIQRIPMVY